RAQAELRNQRLQLPVQPGRQGSEDCLPQASLFCGAGFVNIQTNHRTLPQTQWLTAHHKEQAMHVLQKREGGAAVLWFVVVQQQSAATQGYFSLPQTGQSLSLGDSHRNVGGANDM